MVHRTRRTIVLALVVGALILPAASGPAAPSTPALSSKLIDDRVVADVRQILQSEIVVRSVLGANALKDGMTEADYDALDKVWRAEREAQSQPLIATTLSNPLSAYLTRVQAHSLGLFTEIFVVDEHGLNVGQSNITSDYWQGDEAKFQKTFPVGPNAVFIDEAEYHEGSDTHRAQLNLTVADPSTGRAIGAATFEINLTELNRRKGR